ncbi:MAG: hypothetical protein CMP48_07330 [Rickettsiales bacterium]|nr:hypothetical protein [Rickettsiales bacterium]
MIKSYKDLEIYKRSFQIAMDIFWLTREFPKEEMYSLTSQIVRSSRSISANITEGWAKREYESVFKQHLVTSLGSSAETQNWLLFAFECKYIDQPTFEKFDQELDEIGKMLTKLHQNWKSYGK